MSNKPSIVTHHFVDLEDDEKKDDGIMKKDKVCVIAVGTTGTGKSSLISLYCNNVTVGHGTASSTQNSSLFTKSNNKYIWLDSQGANDSKGVDDKKVLTDVLKKLYQDGVNKIKIVWCVSGDMDRAKDEFQKQARFIKDGLGNKDNSIWSSVLIIKKKATLTPKRGCDGVIDSAKQYGSYISYGNSQLMGFTYYNQDKPTMCDKLEIIFDMTEPNTKQRTKALEKAGFLSPDQVKNVVTGRLNSLPSVLINFNIQKCEKCGTKGDKRFVYAECHTQKEEYHPKPFVAYHPGSWTSSTSYYHSGSWTSNTYHSSGTIRYKYFLFTSWNWGHKHKCCGKEEGSSGCVTDSYYSCCNSSSSSGCCSSTRWYYSCCDNSSRDSEGCKWHYECCKSSGDSKGCQVRCSNADCHKKWGTGPGCIKTTKDK